MRYKNEHWPYSSFSDGYVSISPDGKSIGIWLASGRGSSELWTIPYPAGEPRRALTSEDAVYPFHWMPDSRRILFGGVLPGTIGADLHIADLATGEIVPITKTTQDALQPAISPDAKHIAFTVSEHDFDLLQATLPDPTLKPLLASSLNELSPAWSPVNSQLAFVTDRTGTPQIWSRASTMVGSVRSFPPKISAVPGSLPSAIFRFHPMASVSPSPPAVPALT